MRSNNNDDQALPQVAAYDDDYDMGMIVFISDEDGDYQIWTAEFDYSTPSSVDIDNPTVLPDDDNLAVDPYSLYVGPSLSLCFPEDVWAAWPDERETFNYATYGNYFDN